MSIKVNAEHHKFRTNWLMKLGLDCLQSLKIPEAGLRYQQVVKNHDMTFAWLFEEKTIQFIDWLRESRKPGPAGRIFWITGKPGSGKSTIMKHAIKNPKTIDHLQASGMRKWHMIPFFFSDRGSEKQRSFQTMLQEILYQLLDLIGDAFNLVFPFYTRLTKMQQTNVPEWDLDTLREEISEVIVKSTSKAGICLFMDALDEHGGDNEKLCKFFQDLSSESEGSISLKICLASRPWPVFLKHFRGCKSFAIQEHTRNDIWYYVTSRLQEASESIELRRLATEDQIQEQTSMNQLTEDVTSSAQGVFIWVRLVIDKLCQGLTEGTPISMLRDALKEIPRELEDLYAWTLTKVREQYAAEAHIILHMVLSSLSPLPTQTLFDCVSWLFMDKVDPQKPEAQASRLASRTGGLLETVNSDGSSIVQFIHQTAKEYVRSHGGRLSLKYTAKTYAHVSAILKSYPSSPLRKIRLEFRSVEGPEFLLLCGARKPSCSALIVRHLFAYAEEVDRKLPELSQNMKNLALETFSSVLDNEILWQSSSGYTKLKSFTAGPSRLELAVAANWKNIIRKYYDYQEDFTKITHLAALGPSLLDNFTGRIEMVETLVGRPESSYELSHNPFGYTQDTLEVYISPTDRLLRSIPKSDRMRMLSSVGADAHNIVGDTTLLRTLISIKSHPFVSESERIKMGALLLENSANYEILELGGIIVHLDGRNVDFRSVLSFCLHACSVGWVNTFLEHLRQSHGLSPLMRGGLAHCLASNQNFANPARTAALLREAFGEDRRELQTILDDNEGGLSGVGWPLIWFASQCGIVGFPDINRGFCASGDHRRV